MLKRYEERTFAEETSPNLLDHYEHTVHDYGYWSRNHNMHFGYFRWGMNPFNREAMLEETNRQVISRAAENTAQSDTIIDLGCGLGATMHHGTQNFPDKKFIGATLVPSHLQHSSKRAGSNARVLLADYRCLPLDAASAAGCYAIESAVYASGPSKSDLIAEIARVLKPGGRAVFFDCFLKCPRSELPRPVRKLYDYVCSAWALPEMAQIEKMKEALVLHGLRVIECRDISWNVVPCVAHAPVAVSTYLIRKLFSGEPLTVQSKRHLGACLASVLLGMWRPGFSYFLLSAEKAPITTEEK